MGLALLFELLTGTGDEAALGVSRDAIFVGGAVSSFFTVRRAGGLVLPFLA